MLNKGVLLGLRHFLAIESPLKMMKNAFYFTSKALFVVKIFRFLSRLFGHVAKRLHYNVKVTFKLYDITAWLTNNCYPIYREVKEKTHVTQYIER